MKKTLANPLTDSPKITVRKPEAQGTLAATHGYLPVGTRIRFLKTLTDSASGDHPALLYAQAGDGGEVTGHGCPEGHWVKWDKWPHPFGAELGTDFEAENAELADRSERFGSANG